MLSMPSRLVLLKRNGKEEVIKVSISPCLLLILCLNVVFVVDMLSSAGNWQG